MSRVTKFVSLVVLGGTLGFWCGSLMGDMQIPMMFAGAGIIFGWNLINKIFGVVILSFSPVTVMLLIFRICISMLIGWICIPVEVFMILKEHREK